MTAPEDLVMEDDMALKGEDVFDLGAGENEVRRRGVGRGGRKAVTLDQLVEDQDGMDESDDEGDEGESGDDDDEVLDSEEEQERKTARLEGALDGLYESYKERMSERDAKWKVKQARLKDKNREAWHGIQEGSDLDSDMEGIAKIGRPEPNDEDESDDESVEGGWDVVAKAKAQIGEERDSDDSDSDDSQAGDDQPKRQRVRLALPGTADTKPSIKSLNTKPAAPLVMNIGAQADKAEMSRAAQVWFDQPMFKGVGGLAALDGLDEVEDEDEDEAEGAEEADEADEADAQMADAGEVRVGTALLAQKAVLIPLLGYHSCPATSQTASKSCLRSRTTGSSGTSRTRIRMLSSRRRSRVGKVSGAGEYSKLTSRTCRQGTSDCRGCHYGHCASQPQDHR